MLVDEAVLSPWDGWCLLSLVRHQGRQRFVGNVVETLLGGDAESLAGAGAFAHPSIDQMGLVPGMPEWEYYFHGRGCQLKHRVSNETIDVDFFDDTSDWVDGYFYMAYLRSLRKPALIEDRVRQLYAHRDPIQITVDRLLELGLLETKPGHSAFRLAFDDTDFVPVLDHFEKNDRDAESKARFAAAMGDWDWVCQLVSHPRKDELKDRASANVRKRVEFLSRTFDADESHQGAALDALRDVDSDALGMFLTRALAGPVCGTSSSAIALIKELESPDWCEVIDRFMERLDPNGEAPHPHLWMHCTEYLLKHNHRPVQTRKRLSQAGGTEIAEAALISLEHEPTQAIQLFRLALRSSIPNNRIVASAVLALIDQPWSHRELLSILDETDDQHATCDVRAALKEIPNEQLRERVRVWENKNPHESLDSAFMTMNEMSLQQADEMMRYEMSRWHDRVMPLRAVDPDPPPKRWTFPGFGKR